ncbi:hypothetical protein LO763_06510 [Glycomyces sp. A-F 0318]|uniref:hypothetical protein n=1 Tax=Glycomyces amatae TaxID=2881355 RepID=UPI001E32320E|nr:hypothetical protein [Glycomyces amatae]MCD0443277.1 hypothetical protein [Glycomyces amatae]
MTTNVHDTPLKLCRARPRFAVELAEMLDLALPAYSEVLPYSESATDVEVRDLNADNVVVCREGDQNRLGIIVEVQRGKDKDKLFSWPAYQANIRHRIQAPVLLIVICPRPSVAAWATEPIETGQPGSDFRALVLGSANYPKLTEPSGTGELAERMVLGTLIHEHAEEIEQLLTAVEEELASRPEEVAKRYTEYMLGQLSQQPRAILEALMQHETYPYQSKLLADREARGKAEGRVEEAIEMLLAIIETRGLRITENERRRIEDCGDLAQLRAWGKLSITARSAADIFG